MCPLHPALYHALQHRFGEVRIANAGQRRLTRRVPDPVRPGRFITQAEQRGEQYVVPCPFCHDHKPRLYVSYVYGRRDPRTGRNNYRLWCCHNERCHEVAANRRIFRSMAAAPIGRQRHRARVEFPSSATRPQEAHEIVLPDGLIPIDALPASHPGPAYLQRRGFDCTDLASTWQISFCDSCMNCQPVATNRIVIPVYRPAQMFAPATAEPQSQVLAGWQARIVPGLLPLAGEDNKYLFPSGMQKSELLYGLHLAMQTSGPVFVVEGTSDCWRIGPGAVGLFGKSLSTTEKLLLVHHFAGQPIVILLDRDAHQDAEQIQRQLLLARSGLPGDNRVVIAELPAHRDDPADCTREEIFDAARCALTVGGSAALPDTSVAPF